MNLFVLKTKLLVRRHFCGHAHERSRVWIDHLFYNEQSGRKIVVHFVPKYSSAAPVATVSCASKRLLCRRLSWAVLGLPKFFIPNGKINTKLRFWSLTVKSSWSESRRQKPRSSIVFRPSRPN